jgi:hypothetical protein
MHQCDHMLKQPLVGTIPNEHDVLVRFPLSSQIRPAFGNDSTETVCLYGFPNCCSNPLWIFKNNAAESNIDWRRSALDERSKFRWRLVLRSVSEEKPTDVDIGRPVCWFWHESWRPTVRKGNLECCCKTRAIKHSHLLQFKRAPPLVDDVTEPMIVVSF